MIAISPIRQGDEPADITPLYQSIKQTLQTTTVPLIFQYLATFPVYFHSMWSQVEKNVTDDVFIQSADSINLFAQSAIAHIYQPSNKMEFILEDIRQTNQSNQIATSVNALSSVTSVLYLVSIALRESMKGIHLGLKHIGKSYTDERNEDLFTDVSSDLFSSQQTSLASSKQSLTKTSQSLQTSSFAKFLSETDEEMKKLRKREEYLHRRVALEKFALAKLPLLRHPLDSSFRSVALQQASEKNFPELIYILADLFPTQTPHKLLTTSTMITALNGSWGEGPPKRP